MLLFTTRSTRSLQLFLMGAWSFFRLFCFILFFVFNYFFILSLLFKILKKRRRGNAFHDHQGGEPGLLLPLSPSPLHLLIPPSLLSSSRYASLPPKQRMDFTFFPFYFCTFYWNILFFCFAFVVILMAQALFCLFLFSKATSLNVHLHSVLVWGLGVGSKALQRISGLCILSCTVIL